MNDGESGISIRVADPTRDLTAVMALNGYVCLEFIRGLGHTFTRARDWLYVHQLGVHPLHRRRGVGRALMSQVDTLAQEVGVSEVGLDTWSFNADAIRFFEALGFTAYNVRLWKTGL
jgi:ribosomal protein S18 acetylase RimI-like enzyme